MKILTRSAELDSNYSPTPDDGFKYTINNDGTATVTGISDAFSTKFPEGNVVIPEKVEYNGTDYAVTAIGNQAFTYNTTITSVTGDSIEKIDDDNFEPKYGAFQHCTSLTTVTLPNATTIGTIAFSSCTSLTTITLPKATSIENSAFSSCTSLTTITLPKATSIGNDAFYYCTSLTTVTLPNATSIGNYAFQDCKKLTTITLPKATSIENSAFSSCTALTTITLPKATSIGDDAFTYCTALTTVNLPNTTSIGSYAFKECPALTTVTLPQDDFVYKLNLADKENRKAKIMEYKGNENEVTIPEKVTFSNMDVVNGEYTLETDNITGDFEFSFDDNATVTKYNGNEEYVTIPEKALKKTSETTATVYAVTAIGNQAFFNNRTIKSVTGNSIERLLVYGSHGVFEECKNLKTITLPNATYIGNWAFYDCTALTTVTLPNATSIGNNAFTFCTSLTTVTLPNATSIVNQATFHDCAALKAIIHITNSTEFEYNGEKQKPTFEIRKVEKSGDGYTEGDEVFQENTDYELKYSSDPNSDSDPDLINAGKKSVTIEFKGNNLGGLESVTVNFEITKKDISELEVEVKVDGEEVEDLKHTYNGDVWKPNIILKYEGTILDCTVDTSKNDDMENAGEKTVEITVKDSVQNFKGSKTINLTINKKDISELEVEVKVDGEEVEDLKHTYNGDVWKPNIILKYEGTILDCTVDTSKNDDMENAGEKTVEITVKDSVQNFKGSKTINLTIKPADISGLTVEVDGEEVENLKHTYDGKKWEPEFKFRKGKNYYDLVKDTDYTVEFPEDMTNAGNKTVTITLKDDVQNYTGSKTINNLKINPKIATNFDVECEKVHIYDGKQPEFKIKDGEKELVLGTDYKIVSDKDIKEIGTHNVKIQYIGNYTGEKDIEFEIIVDKSGWGEEVNNGGVINYVDSQGKTSAEITGNEMIWLKESSDGTSAWYAIDNTNGTFKQGSRFWVQWLSPEVDKEKFDEYFNKLDDEHKKQVENNKLWIFLTGVTDPDGNDYTNLDGTVNYYIQLGEDWDENDVKAIFISDKNDNVLQVLFEDVNTPEGTYGCAKILMSHFSPYGVYDPIDSTVPGTLPDDQKSEQSNNNGKSDELKDNNNGKLLSKKENFGQAIKSGLITKISILLFFISIPSVLIFNKLKRKSKRIKN